jgi:uncharacterized membrane protein YtjA (UPF0391 family)
MTVMERAKSRCGARRVRIGACRTCALVASVEEEKEERRKRNVMLYYAVVFLIVALIAGLFGFGIIASTAAGIAKILFMVFLVLFLVSLLMGRRAPL